MKGFYNRTFYDMGKWMLAAVFTVAIFIWMFGDSLLTKMPDCAFERVTGFYCPGCGGTRAVIALFEGHPLKSFVFHPAVLYTFIVYCVFMIKMFLLKHFNIGSEKDGRIVIFIFLGIAIVILQWIVKLILLIGYDVHLI